MRLSLRTKILMLTTGTVAGLATVVLIVLATLAGRQMERAVRNDVRATGGVLAQLIRERSLALKDKCLLLVKQPALNVYILGANSATRNDWATVSDYARESLKQLRADVAVITDQDGRPLGVSDMPAPVDSALEREAGIVAALNGEICSGMVARKGRLMLAVSVPILEPVSRYVKGTFTAYRAIDQRIASELKQALGRDVAFVSQGRVVGASLALHGRIPTPTSAPARITIGPESYLALYSPLPETPPNAGMGFVTLHSYRNAMAVYNRFRTALVAVTGAALLLALAAGAGVARSLTRPLDGVVRAARTLQEGGWPEQFDVRRSDEIGLLQSVFNEMTTAMRESQARLLALIDTDPLTELNNHRHFQERLAQETARCTRSGESLSLLLFDIDHFQAYNRQHGHAAGDKALQQLARVLRECLPEVAILARFGGEEFAVLLPQHGPERAEQVAERIRLAANAAWRESGTGDLTLSAGCATFGTHTSRAEGLVLAAELAVSQAKQLGRNRVCRFDSMPGADATADPYQLHQFLKDGSLATIQALAAAVDAKDTYTQGHSQRVARYAAELAAYVGLSKADVDLVFTAGSLHDVGKIGVPDAILKKAGRLTDEERAVMETHPVLGEVIVRKAPQLAATLPGVRNHHERWDGKGYPDGLAGENIPLIARILAVADTFDAMTSDRPYREGMAWEVALEEIAKGAGTQLDPVLARAFVEMMRARVRLVRAA